MRSVAVIYGKASSTYSFPNQHPMSSNRATAFWKEMARRNLTNTKGIKIYEPIEASQEELRLFHTEQYIALVQQASKTGIGMLDQGDTPAFKGIFEASSLVVGSTLLGLNFVMNEKGDHAFNPIGGLHHARSDSAAGFCVFNDAAIAITKAKREYRLNRILYVDIDAHHGDGIFYSFYDDPKVFIADIHEDGRFLYPGTGHREETGGENAQGTKLSIPLPPASADKQFEKAFNEVKEFATTIKPDLILFQCGGDGLNGDPLAHLRYTPKAYRYAAEQLHQIAHQYSRGRILAMGGGGYNPENTAKAWTEVVEAFLAKRKA